MGTIQGKEGNEHIEGGVAVPPCEEFWRFKSSEQRLIGITGGIGSGKSTVAAMIAAHGHTVMSSDDIARELTTANAIVQRSIAEAFPAAVGSDGTLDRSALARAVFGETKEHAAALKRLNAIVHPAVYRELARRAGECFQRGERFVFNETAILFETGMVRCYDVALVVDAAEEVRIERLVQQRGLAPDDARRRIASQLDAEKKRAAADHVVENGGSLDDTKRAVQEFLQALAEGRIRTRQEGLKSELDKNAS